MSRERLVRPARQKQTVRGGVLAVEFAFAAGLLLFLIVASVELGRGILVAHAVEEAARAGCRQAVLAGKTSHDVETAVGQVMRGVGVANYAMHLTPNPLGDAQQWSPITVMVTVRYDDVSWVPLPRMLQGRQLVGTCMLAREAP